MKKTLLLIFLLGFASTAVHAAFQYKLQTIGTKYPLSSGPYGQDFKLVVSEGQGTVYLSDILRQSPQFTGAVKVSSNDYGFVNLKTGELVKGDSSKTIALENGTTGYKLGDFKAGDEVGIWVRTAAGTGLSVFGKPASDPSFNYRTVENSGIIGNMQFRGADGGTVRYLVSGRETSGGQPLPGVLISLLAGGVAAGAIYYLRARKKVLHA